MRDDLVIGKAEIYDALRRVLDPEIGVSLVDLGLVYGVTINGDDVRVDLTMTTCLPSGRHTRARDGNGAA